ncbi:calnexin independence factor cif1 [Gigaspora margarita]|uniref:Calnexin independence factor cif1 n=1 Tax=Gigaspora margarita TaxID=4874 RepID=A0A8H4ATC1_GIGMA|nr:calnexin independence factor cif1 [Gigaspora margarita]
MGTLCTSTFWNFPIIAINYNTTSDYHWTNMTNQIVYTVWLALENLRRGVMFPQLQIIVPLQPGQVVAFSLHLLLHDNFSLTKGIHHSIVYFVHNTFFHNLQKFDNIYNDLKGGIERNADGDQVLFIERQNLNDAQGLNFQTILFKLKKRQITIPLSSTDCRRDHISLVYARHGLRIEDLLPDL